MTHTDESALRSALDGTFRTFTDDGHLHTVPVPPEHVPDYSRPKTNGMGLKGYRRSPRRLAPEEINRVRAMRSEGDSVYDIARAIGCNQWLIWPVIKDVPYVRRDRQPRNRLVTPAPAALPAPFHTRDFLHVATGTECRITLERIKDAVSIATGVPIHGMEGPLRFDEYVNARYVFYWLGRAIKQASMPEMGRRTGGRDHSTVLHGIKKVSRQRERFAAVIARACATLGIPVPEATP